MDRNILIPLTERAYCRTLRVEDVGQKYVRAFHDPEVVKYLIFVKHTRPTLESLQDYVRERIADEHDIFLGLYIDEEFCGTMRASHLNEESPFIGLAILDTDQWGKGWATLMIKNLCQYLHTNFGKSYFRAGIHKDNIGSQKAFQKAGFISTHKTQKPLSPEEELWILTLPD